MKVTKVLGLAAVGALLILAAPTERAQAMSLANPGAAVGGPGQVQSWRRPRCVWHHHWHRHHHSLASPLHALIARPSVRSRQAALAGLFCSESIRRVWRLILSAEALVRSDPVLDLPGLDLPGRQIFHPPLLPAVRRPMAESRRFLDDGFGDARHLKRRRACRVASLIISTNSGLSAMAGFLAKRCAYAMPTSLRPTA